MKGIVIHNTNNQLLSAERLEKWLIEECKTSQGCHYLVDHKEVRQIMPLDWSVFNTGRGNDFGNLHCIAIEICSNPSEILYGQGESKAIDLIKELMRKYDFDLTDIYFHNEFNPNVNCPAHILKQYGTKKNFIERRLK